MGGGRVVGVSLDMFVPGTISFFFIFIFLYYIHIYNIDSFLLLLEISVSLYQKQRSDSKQPSALPELLAVDYVFVSFGHPVWLFVCQEVSERKERLIPSQPFTQKHSKGF